MTNVYDKEYERLRNLWLWSVNSMVEYVMGRC